jgi:2-C-methyl-D-erythritol 2,4-cyclodiphosphate synthase
MLEQHQLRVANVDISVLAEAPKVAPYRKAMRRRIAALLQVAPQQVNVKATTTEGLGFLGRAEGIAAQATVLLLEAGEAAAPHRESST